MFREQILGYFKNSNSLLLKDFQSGKELTYREAETAIKKISCLLKQHEIGEEDRLAILLENSADFLLLYITCLLQRVVVCPINPKYSPDDVEYCVDLSGAKKIVSSQEIAGLKIPSIYPDEIFSGNIENDELTNITLGGNYQADDLFSITFTSGTTGKPKAIGHRAEVHLGNADAFNRHTGNDKEQRMLHVMPMFYMAGILNTILCPLQAGGSIIIDRSFGPLSPFTFWKNFIDYDCTTVWLSPTMIQAILKLDRNQEIIEKIKNRAGEFNIFSGTAPLSGKSKAEFFEKYNIVLFQSYGLSETLIVSVKESGKKDFNDSVGTVLDGIKISFKDDKEIVLNTNYMMIGYLNSKGVFEKDEERIFSTGDLGEMKENELFITGRKKDLIIKGGENINPKEIENIIQKLDSVKMVAITGFEDEFYGEDIAAFVLPAISDEEKVREEIKKICKEKLKPSLIPAKIIFVRDMPLTPTGKIQKSKLTVVS